MVDISKLPIIKDGKTSIRFWEKVDVKSDDECWKWRSHIDKWGFGWFKIGNKTSTIHRLVYESINGEILKGGEIGHLCNVHNCCNPKHLYIKEKKSLEQRFWSKVDKKGEDDCWNWTAGKDEDGYGMFSKVNKTRKAHKVSYEIHKSIIPEGLCVLHTCDNPSCVNPKHLFLGSTQDNTHDRAIKNRSATGEKNGAAKLNKEDVIKIREQHKSGIKVKKLSNDFNVHFSTVYRIINNDKWRNII